MASPNSCRPSAGTDVIYKAIAYYRLSKYDRSKNQESDSISNQRKLVHAYLARNPNITLVDEADDDGYTGTNFDRPGFQKVLAAVEAGRANCVIVKDLSRLGREYITTGNILERIFPDAGVRFIAINDDVDSQQKTEGNDLIIPIKNLMNESYCRELSRKLRYQFRVQRSNGEFLGAFASYGYCKSPDDKHKLVIDENAAEVVKGIFSLKLQGYSQNAIAAFLTDSQIPTPSEYKKSQGLNYKSGFASAQTPKWSAVTVSRILTNPIYMGTLVQGKRGTPNYKVKRMRKRKEEEWSVVENNHPAIIDPAMFNAVQKMLERDTRTSPDNDTVYPLSGVLFCGDCGHSMLRRSVTRGNRKFCYYICSGYKKGTGCASHSFECTKLETTVLNSILNQIKIVVDMETLVEEIGVLDISKARIRQLDLAIAGKVEKLEQLQNTKMSLYEALVGNILSLEEYNILRSKYSKSIEEIEDAIDELTGTRDAVMLEEKTDSTWIEQFIKFKDATELSREMVFTLIDKIYVYSDKRIHIEFNFRDEYSFLMNLLEKLDVEVN